jgi:cob(I)alamin adenosyltransferase
MSIVTKKGDHGATALMYNRHVSKTDPRIEAYGCVDELTSALGLARATAKDPFIQETVFVIQKDLIALMGELATLPEDRERYAKDGFSVVTPQMTARLDALVARIEAEQPAMKDWAIPGNTLQSAALDLARAAARRAERAICPLQESNTLSNAEILVYLNRLSDLLWLLARWSEKIFDETRKTIQNSASEFHFGGASIKPLPE